MTPEDRARLAEVAANWRALARLMDERGVAVHPGSGRTAAELLLAARVIESWPETLTPKTDENATEMRGN